MLSIVEFVAILVVCGGVGVAVAGLATYFIYRWRIRHQVEE